MKNLNDYIKSSESNLDLHEILQASTKVLLGVTDDAAQALLDHLGIKSIFDLAMSRVFSNAHDLLLAGLDPTNTLYKFGTPPADIVNESLVKEVRIDELRFESIGILEGITPASATLLSNALDVKTVRDLALYPPYVAARDIFVSVFFPQTLPTFDKDAPSDLVPQSGQYPTERVFYKSLVIDELEEDVAELKNLDTAGPVDISPVISQKFGFRKPAIGALLTFSQSWFAQGVALGQLLHSLALAPGESTRMAMIDWSRRIQGKQQEDITETEQLSNTTQHNRAISEVTNAVASEAQSGFSKTHADSVSSQKGSALGIGLGPLTLGGSSGSGFNTTDAMSFSSSSGRRDLSASMSQNVMDSTQQNANAVRNRRASVVKEVSQEEHEKVSTRIVTNYNHMHAMSVQYYEVIQIYRVVVQLSEVEKCLFIPMQLINFENAGLVRKFREALVQAALSQEAFEMLTNNYDTVDVRSFEDGYISLRNGGLVPHDTKENAKVVGLPNETRLTGFYLMPAGVDPALRIVIYLRDGSTITPTRSGQDFKLSDACLIHEVDFIGMTNPTPAAVFSFLAAVNFIYKGTPFGFDVPIKLEANSATQKILTFAGGGVRSKLIDHLKANQLHYSQAIFNSLDPATITLLLSAYSYNNKPVTVQIDPQPITTAGNYLVFKMHVEPDTDGQYQEEREWAKWMAEHGIDFAKIKQEIVPLPSGGVFAEAVLGRYNSAEKLDMTRFWNWQDSPIPFAAPEIAPIQTGSRGTEENLKPGNLSQPLVNIVSPTSLPDPTGMSAVLQTIANGNMFRDMSGLANTIGLAQAALASSGQGAGEAASQAGSNLAVAAKKEVEMFKAALAFVASMYGKGSLDTSPSTISNEGAKINHGRSLDQRNSSQSSGSGGTQSSPDGSFGSGSNGGGTANPSLNIPGLTNTGGLDGQEQAAFSRSLWGTQGDSLSNIANDLYTQTANKTSGSSNPKTLSHYVVISAPDGTADKWATQYVHKQPLQRRNVNIPINPSSNQVLQTYRAAAISAGNGGVIIVNVGHGGIDPSTNLPTDGILDIAPNKKFRVGGLNVANSTVNIFYDISVTVNSVPQIEFDRQNLNNPKAQERLANWQIYKDIGQALRNANIYKIVLLTCRVGRATDFLKKIANDWGVVIEAYKDFVALQEINNRVRIFLKSDQPGSGTNVALGEEELPLANDNNSFRAGPPISSNLTGGADVPHDVINI